MDLRTSREKRDDERPSRDEQSRFAFSAIATALFRKRIEMVKGGLHKKLTQSQMIELYEAHWEQHPPEISWVLNFEFQTKRGRPRTRAWDKSDPAEYHKWLRGKTPQEILLEDLQKRMGPQENQDSKS